MFANASLADRFYSITIPSKPRAEVLLSMKGFSTRISHWIRHVRLSGQSFQLPSCNLMILNQVEVQERIQDFLMWTFKNVLSKLTNLTSLSFIDIALKNTASPDNTLWNLKALSSLTLPPRIKHVTLKNCEVNAMSYNLLLSPLTQVQSLVIDDTGLSTGPYWHSASCSFPTLTNLTIMRSKPYPPFSSWPQKFDQFVDMSKIKKLSINIYEKMGVRIAQNSIWINDKLAKADLLEELEFNIRKMEQSDTIMFASFISLQNIPNLRVLKLGILLKDPSVCTLLDSLNSRTLQTVEGECNYQLRCKESLFSTLKKVDEAIFRMLERCPELSAKNFKLQMKVKSLGIVAEDVIARLRPAFSKLCEESVIIDVVL
ncbi:hypothetical protein C8Q75DRAFT_833224 [Abortiporus biennis]|nr:hypothetical protein C8Q75DRAFT_833224 [Abortiporus biennis]